MATMLRRFVRVARGLSPMTEPEAFITYKRHVDTCGGCATGRTPEGGWGNGRCAAGLQLHAQWQAAVDAQHRVDEYDRRRATAGSGRR